jgi:lipoprotein-releasing system permease protein
MLMMAIVGVALGVMALINISSVMNGFTHKMYKKINASYDVNVVSEEESVHNMDEILNNFDIKSDIKYLKIADNYFSIIGKISSRVYLYDKENFAKISNKYGVIVNNDFAKEINVNKKDSVVINYGLIGHDYSLETIMNSDSVRLKVVGLNKELSRGVHIPKELWDENNMIDMPMRYLQGVKLHDFTDAEALHYEIKNFVHENVETYWWGNSQKNFLDMVKLESLIIKIVILFVLVISCFNVIASNILIINEKKQDIFIYRTLGYSKKFVGSLFLSIGVFIGFIGLVLGLMGGFLVLDNLTYIVQKIEIILSVNLFPFENGDIPYLINGGDLFIDISIVALMIILSSIIPAMKAAMISPADGLKNE